MTDVPDGSDGVRPDPVISAVIVNFNGGDVVLTCVKSLFPEVESGLVEVIVVDNGSTDGSDERVRNEAPWARVVRTPANGGYAYGVNFGAMLMRGKHLLVLNNDVVLEKGAIVSMHSAMCSDEHVAIVGPKTRMPDGEYQFLQSRQLTPLRLLAQTLPLPNWLSNSPLLQVFEFDRGPDDGRFVEKIGGHAMLVRHSAIAAVGMLDPGFKFYFEDTDWCRRFRSAGWTILYLPDAEVLHECGYSTGNASEWARLEWYRSMFRYCSKHFGTAMCVLMRLLVIGRSIIGYITHHREPAELEFRRKVLFIAKHYRFESAVC